MFQNLGGPVLPLSRLVLKHLFEHLSIYRTPDSRLGPTSYCISNPSRHVAWPHKIKSRRKGRKGQAGLASNCSFIFCLFGSPLKSVFLLILNQSLHPFFPSVLGSCPIAQHYWQGPCCSPNSEGNACGRIKSAWRAQCTSMVWWQRRTKE